MTPIEIEDDHEEHPQRPPSFQQSQVVGEQRMNVQRPAPYVVVVGLQ